MSLEIIIGPMKGGKTEILCAEVGPFQHSSDTYLGIMSTANTRDDVIQSRSGAKLPNTIKITNIEELHKLISEYEPRAVAIDEFHFFDAKKLHDTLNRIMKANPQIEFYVAGLDKDYRGEILDGFQELLKLPYDNLKVRRAVCDDCKKFNATNSMIRYKGFFLSCGLPQPIPEGEIKQMTFSAHCKSCFDNNIQTAIPYDRVDTQLQNIKLKELYVQTFGKK